MFSGVDPKFPMHLWCRLILQTFLTLNLVRPSHVDQKLSAHAYFHEYFDYNDIPLAPLVWAIQLYVKPNRRNLWYEHSTSGYYVDTFDWNYRCHSIGVGETKSEIVTDTLFFKHKYITQPNLTPEDVLVKSLQDFNHEINGTTNHKGNKKMESLVKM